MRDEPGRIPEILENYREKTATDLEFRTGVLERLKQVDPNSISSIRELGEYLKGIAEKRPLPASDVELQFYRIDGLTREEMILIFILEGSHKSLERARTEAAAAARQEWYEIYRMADWVQTYYLDADGNETGDNVGSTFYVNQTCYNFPYNNADRLHTRMYDLLTGGYDLVFRELRNDASMAPPEGMEELKKILAEINREFLQISKEILEKPDQELAELTRHDSQAGAMLRDRINAFVDKYLEETDDNIMLTVYKKLSDRCIFWRQPNHIFTSIVIIIHKKPICVNVAGFVSI